MPTHTIEVNGVTQRFNYRDSDDLVAQLTEAQKNATVKIAEQSQDLKRLKTIGKGGNGNGHGKPAPKFEPVAASKAQLDTIALLIGDPATAAEGIKQAVELGLGGSMEEVQKSLQAGARLAEQQRQFAEGEKFRRQNPDFMLYGEAERTAIEVDIFQWLVSRNLEFTAENFGKAYEDLGENELLPARPVPQTTTTEPAGGELPSPSDGNSETRRARASFSTGVRAGVGRHEPPAPVRKSSAEVWAEIDAMSDSQYDAKMRDPEFRKLVDSLPKR